MTKNKNPDIKGKNPKEQPKNEVQKTAFDDASFLKAIGRLKRLMDLIKGKEDVRNRLNAILKPDQIQTSTNLTAEQVNMVIDSYWFYGQFPELYQPLKDLADNLMLTSLSLKGYGIEQSVKLVGAIEQSQYFKAMLGSTQEPRHHTPAFKKAETKQ